MNRAIIGELMTHNCQIRGLAGVVVDGSIRDCDAIKEMGFPVYARGVSPNGPYKNGPGEIGYPVSVGGQVVCSGDIIIGDMDGIIAVKTEDAPHILQKVKELMIKEEAILEEMDTYKTYTREWMNNKLEAIGCDFN